MGLTSSKPTTMSSSQPLPTSSTMNTPSKLTPNDRGTFELLLQMGYTAQDALQQMTQAPVATPSADLSTAASTATPTDTAPSAVPPMVQEGSQRPSTNTANVAKSDKEETERLTWPPPPPAFSDNTPYNVIAFSTRPTLGTLWKHYNPTGPFNAQGFSQLSTRDSLDLTSIETASITCCSLRGQPAYILSYGKLGNEPGVSGQLHPSLFSRRTHQECSWYDRGSYRWEYGYKQQYEWSNKWDSSNEYGTWRTNTTARSYRTMDLSGQKRRSQRSPTPPECHHQRTHTPPECHNQTSTRILLEIRGRPAPVKLVKKYSGELWNKWKANYEPCCTHTQHMDAFCKYVIYEMIKGWFGSKLKILYELLYQYQDHYRMAIHEDNIRKIKQRLIGCCRSWREQYGRFMFIPGTRDPIPQYLGYTLSEP